MGRGRGAVALESPDPWARRALVGTMVLLLAALVLMLLGFAFYVFRMAVAPGIAWNGAGVPDPGEVRTVDLGGGVQLELVWITPGAFMMGSSDSLDRSEFGPEVRSHKSETPRHEVEISRGFWMGRHEVTNAQFRRFRPGHNSGAYRGFSLDGDAQPVVNVSWEDARAFCDWLSSETGFAFRLPSEAEWEYACRAGSSELYAEGDTPASLRGFANVMNPSVAGVLGFDWTPFPWEDGISVTSAVGQFRPNAWGLYDMHGNAWEWCADWFDEGYYARSPARDPQGPSSGTVRVQRGGSWSDTPWYCRSAFRNARSPELARVYDGFRVAGTAPIETVARR
ncbi:MAG: formylglycine-generating enzyme family protein [Candidatus Hydrogenedentes bacterium]|nr:formylglycine-generating enzyme family protein [Candidatus Hydrogenedentota bacterium]